MTEQEVDRITLANQVDMLLQYGASKDLNTSYRSIADVIGVTPSNLHKIHQGANKNPGIRLLRSLVDYFGVDLAYFDCKTVEECEDYLRKQAEDEVLDEVAMRADRISPEGLKTIREMIEYVKKAEGLEAQNEE